MHRYKTDVYIIQGIRRYLNFFLAMPRWFCLSDSTFVLVHYYSISSLTLLPSLFNKWDVQRKWNGEITKIFFTIQSNAWCQGRPGRWDTYDNMVNSTENWRFLKKCMDWDIEYNGYDIGIYILSTSVTTDPTFHFSAKSIPKFQNIWNILKRFK